MDLRKIVFVFFCLLYTTLVMAQVGDKIFLYEGQQEDDSPCIYVNLVKSNDVLPTVLVMPGGGYHILAMGHEGEAIVKWFLERGVHAIILQYSLGQFDGSGNKHPQMINDAQRAMRIIRQNAAKWKVNPNMIAVMGFSAGGHLASTLGTHSDSGNVAAEDPIEKQSCTPNLCILSYPVIMMEGEDTHWGSRRFLLGPTPRLEDVKELSNEKQVSVITPPTILFHTSDDPVVPVENSINYYLALRKQGIPAEMHVFEHGAHGVGLIVDDYGLAQWEGLLENWLVRWKWIKK